MQVCGSGAFFARSLWIAEVKTNRCAEWLASRQTSFARKCKPPHSEYASTDVPPVVPPERQSNQGPTAPPEQSQTHRNNRAAIQTPVTNTMQKTVDAAVAEPAIEPKDSSAHERSAVHDNLRTNRCKNKPHLAPLSLPQSKRRRATPSVANISQ